MHRLNSTIENMITDDYNKSKSRLILLDYDGTLSPFYPLPEMAKPSEKILQTIRDLSEDLKNEIVIISGRDKATLSEWFSGLRVSLVAEHGNSSKKESENWQNHGSPAQNWKDKLKTVMEVSDRTPDRLKKEYSSYGITDALTKFPR